ncbi:hypothetical protein HYU95_00740 [Candidatus Daviesbacteria bacterium]|nr:hypothetical protein [Candidatus Daviesbacteria bacterium]
MKTDFYNEEKAAEIRASREQSPENQARKRAAFVYAALQTFSKGIHNSGNILERLVAAKILEGQPLSLTAFWGVGGKRSLNTEDEKLLSEYEKMRESIQTIYPQGANIQLLLADKHGFFNKFTGPQVYEYLVRIQDQANKRGINTIWLSDLYRQWNLVIPDSRNLIDEPPSYGWLWHNPKYFRQHAQLVQSAGKHHQSEEDPEQVAYHYAVMRLQEAPFLAKTFPDTILLINSSKDLAKLLLPQDLPHLYLRVSPVWFEEAK